MYKICTEIKIDKLSLTLYQLKETSKILKDLRKHVCHTQIDISIDTSIYI